MAESALFKSYRATEKQKAEQALDEALGRLEAAPVADEAPITPVPDEGVAPAARPERAPGVFASIKYGLSEIPARFNQGRQEISEGLDALSKSIVGEDRTLSDLVLDKPEPSGLDRLKQGGLGGLTALVGLTNVIFPFSAFAGSVGGDFQEWLAQVSRDMSDEKLQAARAHAEQHAPGTLPIYDAMLSIPYAERIQRAREAGSLSSEIMSGIIPGFSSPADVKRPAA